MDWMQRVVGRKKSRSISMFIIIIFLLKELVGWWYNLLQQRKLRKRWYGDRIMSSLLAM